MDLNMKRTWAEIRLDNVVHNLKTIRATLPAGTRFLGVVKADAYGHGAVAVSRTLEANGADYLAVSCLDEALELRAGCVSLPILILGHTPVEYLPILLAQNLTQTVSNLAKAREYSDAARALGQTLRIHVKLDTGMGRLGFLCDGERFAQGVENVAAAWARRGSIPAAPARTSRGRRRGNSRSGSSSCFGTCLRRWKGAESASGCGTAPRRARC